MNARNARIASAAVLFALATTAALGGGTPADANSAAPTCFGEEPTITDASIDEYGVIHGTTGDDVIYSEKRYQPSISGHGGNDLICVVRGTLDEESLSGGPGDDRILGAGGDEWLDGGAGDDELNGGAGHDDLSAGRGRDLLFGGKGPDDLDGGGGDDELHGGSGEDYVIGGGGIDVVDGGGGGRDVCDKHEPAEPSINCEDVVHIQH